MCGGCIRFFWGHSSTRQLKRILLEYPWSHEFEYVSEEDEYDKSNDDIDSPFFESTLHLDVISSCHRPHDTKSRYSKHAEKHRNIDNIVHNTCKYLLKSRNTRSFDNTLVFASLYFVTVSSLSTLTIGTRDYFRGEDRCGSTSSLSLQLSMRKSITHRSINITSPINTTISL